MPVDLFLICGCMCFQWQSWVVITETIWAAEPKIFIMWAFAEKASHPDLYHVWEDSSRAWIAKLTVEWGGDEQFT